MVRNSLLIHYSFYKNAAIFLVLVWLAFFSGFSAQVRLPAVLAASSSLRLMMSDRRSTTSG